MMTLKGKISSVLVVLALVVGFAGSASADTLLSIQITQPATKLVYNVGESLDISGLEVTGTYDVDGDILPFPESITDANISGFDSSVPANDQVLTVTVGGETDTYTVDILSAPVLISIAITNPANTLTYNVGDALDISGLEVTGTYDVDGDLLPFPESITDANISGFDSSVAVAGQFLTITVDGKTTGYNVDIIEAPETPTSTPDEDTSSRRRSGGRGSAGSVLGAFTSADDEGQVLGATTTDKFIFETNLAYGMRNEDVMQLQLRLAAEGFFKVNPTGYFGPITLQAVKDYQTAHGIPYITGFCGPLTRAELNK